MRLATKHLSALEIKAISKPGLHAVGTVPGLYLKVDARGNKSWVLRALIGIRRRSMGLGGYPAVPLAEACKKAREARVLIEQGQDPIETRQAAKSGFRTITFAEASKRFIASKETEWKNKKHAQQWRNTLKTYASEINSLPVSAISTPHVLGVLEKIWITKTTTATRVRERIEKVLDWATAMNLRTGENPARLKGNLDKLLPAAKKISTVKHHASLPWRDTPRFIAALKTKGKISARALEFTILTACRTGEVLGARWEEIDLESKRWTIPSSRMKSGREHQVPLNEKSMSVISGLPRVSEFIFTANGNTPLSNMTMLNLLKTMKDSVTVHGFRSTFRTWAAEETNHPSEVCEAALAHRVGDDTELSYKRTDYFNRREVLMQEWADFLHSDIKEDS